MNKGILRGNEGSHNGIRVKVRHRLFPALSSNCPSRFTVELWLSLICPQTELLTTGRQKMGLYLY